MLGTILFGKYRILKPIGRGGTSVVYLAENIKLRSKWAIKVIHKSQSELNFLAEPKILKELNHPAIPKIIDIEEDADNIYIIEEYVEGINLREYKEKHIHVNETDIVQWGGELCEILHYLHTRKPYPIIYRDMKPDNIILMENGCIKLIDFGISREYKYQAHSDTMQIGSRGFAAPEQYGGAQSDERSDIYGVGLTLYYLATGKTLSDPPYKILPINNEIKSYSNQLNECLMTATSLLPADRFQEALAFKKQLGMIHQPNTHKSEIIGTVLIGVMGLMPRIGTTHTVLTLGSLLTDKGYKAAIVDFTNSNDFTHIKNMYYDSNDLGEQFILRNIAFYLYQENRDLTELLTGHLDYVILDLGGFNVETTEDLIAKCHVKLVVCGGKDWEIPMLDNFLLSCRSAKSFKYCFSFMDEENIKHIRKNMKGFNCFVLPYSPNPYQPSKAANVKFNELIKSYLPKKQQKKKRWFRRRSDEKKTHVTR